MLRENSKNEKQNQELIDVLGEIADYLRDISESIKKDKKNIETSIPKPSESAISSGGVQSE